MFLQLSLAASMNAVMFADSTAGGMPPPHDRITLLLSFRERTSSVVTRLTSAGEPLARTSRGGILPSNVTVLSVRDFSSLSVTSNPMLKRLTFISGRYGADTLHRASL
jgi:hypothetical protein